MEAAHIQAASSVIAVEHHSDCQKVDLDFDAFSAGVVMLSDAVRLGPTQQVEAAQRERSPCRPTGRQDNSADKTMESVN